MNVYRFELRRLRGSVAGWSAAVCCFLWIYLGMYPLFREDGAKAAGLFAKFPETLQALCGMDHLDLSSVRGFLSFPMKLVQELLAIGGFMLGVRVISHDTRSKCADFLYALPVSRRKVFRAKAGAVFTLGAAFFAVTALGAGGMSALVAPGELPARNLLACAAVCALLFCLYGAAGLLVGARFPRIRGTAAIGVASMFFFHIVFSVCKVITRDAGSLAARLLVPVFLFDRELAAERGIIEPPFLLLWCAEAALLLLLAGRTLRRRDVVCG
ncbi:hypothetical protein CE91St41_07790 [Oscillospiraceae bacterium]|nr:hypothetical protein CE91St40_07790 [Oscillospiraceae bacterium]BDF73890.1 hypothetical protein CE91St41_07790 [Oscillospiraceae bacterium]